MDQLLQEIAKLVQNGEFQKAKQFADKIGSDVDRYNVLGIIFYQEGKLDEAMESFKKSLEIDPTHDDALFNYAKVLFERNEYFESWRYLTRIKQRTWEVYDMLGDTQLKQNNPAMAIHYYKKAAELSDQQQMKEKYQQAKNMYKKSEKLAIFCLPGLDNFIKDIADILSNVYDVKFVVTTDGKQIVEAYNWADIVWLEWANELAVEITNKLPKAGKRVLCRLHSYEALANYPENINWRNVDTLILVADHMRNILEDYHSQVYKNINDKITIISNGVDLNKFSFKIRSPGHNIAIVAHINHKKDPAMWLQVIGMLKKIDERYKLHIAGDFQEIRYANYFKHFIKDAGLEKNVQLYGFVKDIEAFLEDKNYLLSTSIHESFGYNIAEAMARGIKPIIHNYAGSKTQWPEKLIYNFIDEIRDLLYSDYNSEEYRRFVEDNCSLEKQIDAVTKALENENSNDQSRLITKGQIDKADFPTKAESKEQETILRKVETLDEVIDLIDEFMSTNTCLIDSFDFSDARVIAGKFEKISQGFYSLDFLLSNFRQNLVIIGIFVDLKNSGVLYPKYIQRSRNHVLIEEFLKKILKNEMIKIPQNVNIHSFVYDEILRRDIESKRLAYTWERALPGTEFMPIRGLINVALRYSLVKKFLKSGEKVLEAGCGFGYGAAFISGGAESVVGLDIAPDSIEFCRRTYRLENVQWVVGDVTDLKFGDNTFDIYVSYETLEHLPLDKIERYFQEAKRVLKNGGHFIISTPNKMNRLNLNNPFHVKEYTFTELRNLVERYFNEVEYYSLEEVKLHKGVSKSSTVMIAVGRKENS